VDAGFTLLEIVVTLVVIGVLTLFAVSRVDDGEVKLVTQTEVIKSHIRYAQAMAMNTNGGWGVEKSGNSYSMFRNGAAGSKVLLPGENSLDVDLADKGISVDNFIIAFDDWGTPYTAANMSVKLDSEMTITVSGKIETRDIRITPETGFIP
jgi:MSHA pilin protein MshC